MNEAVLEIGALTRRFGAFAAVDALTLSVNAGKTTTSKVLTHAPAALDHAQVREHGVSGAMKPIAVPAEHRMNGKIYSPSSGR